MSDKIEFKKLGFFNSIPRQNKTSSIGKLPLQLYQPVRFLFVCSSTVYPSGFFCDEYFHCSDSKG